MPSFNPHPLRRAGDAPAIVTSRAEEFVEKVCAILASKAQSPIDLAVEKSITFCQRIGWKRREPAEDPAALVVRVHTMRGPSKSEARNFPNSLTFLSNGSCSR